jgi:hypothetical protein
MDLDLKLDAKLFARLEHGVCSAASSNRRVKELLQRDFYKDFYGMKVVIVDRLCLGVYQGLTILPCPSWTT